MTHTETLEEAILERKFKSNYIFSPDSFVEGVKWQAERMYSEADMQEYAKFCIVRDREGVSSIAVKEWFEQFKKKP